MLLFVLFKPWTFKFYKKLPWTFEFYKRNLEHFNFTKETFNIWQKFKFKLVKSYLEHLNCTKETWNILQKFKLNFYKVTLNICLVKKFSFTGNNLASVTWSWRPLTSWWPRPWQTPPGDLIHFAITLMIRLMNDDNYDPPACLRSTTD